ncbi:O-methyltransferase [Erysipelotrichaceae bacterium OttesenSCG-928-M19]|nr:O-methyltransferase [Erysipelotrichaceae bacterium OttesenSCG-928-M19]
MLKELEKYAAINDIPIIEQASRDFIIKYIKDNNVKNILEIGSAIGYSALVMSLQESVVHIDSVERDGLRYNLALENIVKYQKLDKITLYHHDALLLDMRLLKRDYDLIFIDAAKAQYQKFFEKYVSLLNSDGAIIIDNINFHGFVFEKRVTNNRNTRQLVQKIRKFIEWLEKQTKYEATYYNIGDGIYVVKRKM